MSAFLSHLMMDCNLSFALFQEFSSQTEFQRLDTHLGSIFVFPGISSKSRSNAIFIVDTWMPLLITQSWCKFGGHVVVKCGWFALVLESLHIPYAGHEIDLNDALAQVVDMRSRTEQKLVKLGFGCNILWAGGGDVNEDLRKRSNRSAAICDMISPCDLVDPDNPYMTSHTHWDSLNESLIDWH